MHSLGRQADAAAGVLCSETGPASNQTAAACWPLHLACRHRGINQHPSCTLLRHTVTHFGRSSVAGGWLTWDAACQWSCQCRGHRSVSRSGRRAAQGCPAIGCLLQIQTWTEHHRAPARFRDFRPCYGARVKKQVAFSPARPMRQAADS